MNVTNALNKYNTQLNNNPKAMNYLLNRGLTIETIQHFRLGLSLDYMTEKNNSATTIDIEMSTNNKHPYFINRIMIPINRNTFTSRDLGDVVTKQKVKDDLYIPKYKHSKRYKKGSMLYNAKSLKGKDGIRKKAIVVESHFNTVSLHQELVKAQLTDTVAVVGVGGSELTQDHVDILKSNNTVSVTLMFDGDTAGVKGMINATLLLIKNRMEFDIVILDNGKDVNDILMECVSVDSNGIMEVNNSLFLSKTLNKNSINGFVFYSKYLLSITANREKLKKLKDIQNVFKEDIMNLNIFKDIQPLLMDNKFNKNKSIRYLQLIFNISPKWQ